jgi:hypothetical protein
MMTKELEERLKEDPILREFYYKLPPLTPRPKTEVHIQLEGEIAEAARANPNSVWVHVRSADGILLRASRGTVQAVEVKP